MDVALYEAQHPPCANRPGVEHTKDVVAMNRSLKSVSPRRVRAARLNCRGGASSVLRLAAPVAKRLPTSVELSDWVSRAASALMPVTGPHGFQSTAGTAGA